MDAKSLYPDWKKILTELVEHYGSAWKLTQAMQAIDSSISINYYNAIATLLKQEQIKTMSYERGALLLHLHQQLKSVGGTESVGAESVGTESVGDEVYNWRREGGIKALREAASLGTRRGMSRREFIEKLTEYGAKPIAQTPLLSREKDWTLAAEDPAEAAALANFGAGASLLLLIIARK